jgi:UDP-2,3-diacylglucosamine pyrophosphatase LpxH
VTKHTIVLSDVHLSQAHPEDPDDPLWMRYRRRDHHPDAELAALVDHLLERFAGDRIELVFNGDLFDFDTPWVKDGASSFDEHPPTDEGCAAHVRLILADHEPFFRAVAKLLEHGHAVTFISGNHDLELCFPAVREAIRSTLARWADPAEVRFRAWFHLSSDGIYFEHGSQYDIHNGVRHPMLPFTREGDRLHPVLGKLAFRRTGSRMGYFNPYYEETFYMGLFGYLGHFVKAYAFTKRSIVKTWATGAFSTVFEILRHRHREERIEEGRTALRAEVGAHVTDAQIDATQALRAKLAEETMIPVVRELWVDRVVMAGFVLLAFLSSTIALGIVGGLATLGALIVLFVLYEVFTPKPDIRTYDSAPEAVLELFDIHGVRAICMGHTHRPFVRVVDAGVYANSGAWCPAYVDAECTKRVLERRPVLILSTRGDALWGGLQWWNGALEADPDHSRTEVNPVRRRPDRNATPSEAAERSPASAAAGVMAAAAGSASPAAPLPPPR